MQSAAAPRGRPADLRANARAGARAARGSSLRGVARLSFFFVLLAATLFMAQHTALRDTNHGWPAQHLSFPLARLFPRPVPAADQSSAFDDEVQMNGNQLLNRWNPLVAAASKQFGVPMAWIRAVIARESGGRTMSSESMPITSPAGAVGLMQLMPETYKEMRSQYKLGANPFNPRDNIVAGTAYLRWLHGRYGFPAMFAVYNDGPGNYEKRMANGQPLPAETRAYIATIATNLGARSGLQQDLVQFTRPNGDPVWVNGPAAVSVRTALRGEYARTVKTVITVDGVSQGVREKMTDVVTQLRAHHAII